MLTEVERTLRENIDDEITIEISNVASRIPIFLKNIYKVYKMKILGIQCTLLEIRGEAPGVDAIKKHINTVREITGDPIVLYFKEISRYRRKSLIQNRISFIIEDGQMFLPFLGLALENVDDGVQETIKSFTPSGQVAFLYFLYNKEATVNATEFSELFDWTPMTSSRALNELYKANLLTYKIGGKTGRSKYYSRISDPDYFENGKELLNSPIKRLLYVRKEPEGSLKAGLEALSELSMVNPPGYKVRALHGAGLNMKELEIVENIDIIKDENLLELQIWDYDPKLFANKGIVDKASLFSSLKNENDERIEQALEEALREEAWYMD